MNHNWIEDKIPDKISEYWSHNIVTYKICTKCKIQTASSKSIENFSNQFIRFESTYYYLNDRPCSGSVIWDELTCEEILIKSLLE